MRYIKRKNLLEGEVLFDVPEIHWMYLINPLLVLLLLCVFFFTALLVSPVLFQETAALEYALSVIKYLFIVVLIIMALFFIRRIGLFFSTEYGVTGRRFIAKKGFCRVSLVELCVEKAESAVCVQNLGGRLFNYGTVRVTGLGGTRVAFAFIHKPRALLRKIERISGNKKQGGKDAQKAPAKKNAVPVSLNRL